MAGKCALVQGWENMGLEPEKWNICAISPAGDYGHANALDLQGNLGYAPAPKKAANTVISRLKN